MNDALTLIHYILTKFFSTIFSLYLFDGVSIGMIFIVVSMFYILIHYAIAIPKVHTLKGGKEYERKNI